MTEDDAFNKIWALAKPKTGNWRKSTWPVIRTAKKPLRARFDKCISEVKDLAEWVLQVELALQAQQKDRHLSQQSGFMEQPIMFERWLNEERWTMEIESSQERREQINAKFCPQCGEEYPCPKHFYDNLRDDWRWKLINEHWRKLGKPKTQAECIEALKKEGKLNLLLMVTGKVKRKGDTLTKMGDM